mgnify:CR=1 FL=1
MLFRSQSQLSQSESEWREEFDAVQQQLLEQVTEAESMSMQLQAQAARADEATARCRQAEAEVQQCRHTMQLDAGRLQRSEHRGRTDRATAATTRSASCATAVLSATC